VIACADCDATALRRWVSIRRATRLCRASANTMLNVAKIVLIGTAGGRVRRYHPASA